MNTVLRIDLQSHASPGLKRNKLVHPCWTEPLLGSVINGQVLGDGNAVVLEGEVRGLVVLVVGPAQSHGGEQVEADLAIRLWVLDWGAVLRWLQLSRVLTCMFQGPGLFPSEYPVKYSSVHHSPVKPKIVMEGRADVPHSVQLFPNPRLSQALFIFRNMNSGGL
uniref:Uncharacterized protein n=1 Tax=Anguilla anguilla TaxID=7936 RepID=A0A0E9X4W9_ANGAN